MINKELLMYLTVNYDEFNDEVLEELHKIHTLKLQSLLDDLNKDNTNNTDKEKETHNKLTALITEVLNTRRESDNV